MKKLFAFAVLTALGLQAQAQVISGKVTNTEGEALPGASISIKPTGRGTLTGDDGSYRLELTKAGTFEVTASFIGYRSGTRKVSLKEDEQITLNFVMSEQQELLDAVNISAVRASENAPVAQSTLSQEEIEQRDEGRDIPFILRDLPSTVVTSDAGAGIGYTGMRIRGSDISRINVTINGVPLNDPESHGVFWVNTPDLASSTNSMQVQRGVGTSTNGAGAFGASINMKTSSIPTKAFAATEITAGSFNSLKTKLQVGSGLLNDHWAIEARLSKVQSDGFIDRATSDLKSYYISGSYYSENTSVQLIHFAGGEETYQAWWGIPEGKLNGNDSLLQYHIAINGYDAQDSANLVNSDPRTYNYYTYENEVDNYKQDHYQLHFSHRFSENFLANAALHYTWGRGYYEQYRKDDDLADYGLSPVILGADTVSNTDLIRRRWLDNGFAGATYSLEYDHNDRLNISFGGAYNRYEGDHFGEIIWAEFASNSEIRDRYYDNTSVKTDFNNFLKGTLSFGKLTAYADMQLRVVDYTGEGVDADGSMIGIEAHYQFFNPKAGLSYAPGKNQRAYASVAVAHREPVRTDFLDAPADLQPTPEQLVDYEAGYEYQTEKAFANVNFFYMDYTDQLVLTGQVNDVGSAIRVNAPESYRLGMELVGRGKINNWLQLGGNLTLSENKILNFTDYVVDYDNGGYQTTTFQSTDISFSPNVTGHVEAGVMPFEGFNIILGSKYVGRQFLDNTGSVSKSLDPYAVTDLRLQYNVPQKFAKQLQLHLLVANLFNVEYAPNGYTYSYIWSGKITENFYYPMAGINFLGGVKLRL